MEIAFEDHRVKELFEDLNDVAGSCHLMQKKIGAELTRNIKKKYNQIKGFSTFAALQASGIGRMESLSGSMTESYSLRVSGNYRLIIRPESPDRSAEELKECDTVIIEGVIDYHDRNTRNNWIIP